MFLNRLNTEEKKNFISLAVRAAQVNGVVAREEYSLIEAYCNEMGIPFSGEDIDDLIEDITAFFEKTDSTSKRIAVLEIIGLMYADGVYDDDEKGFVESFAKGIGLSEKSIMEASNLISRYLDLTKEMMEFIA